MNITKEKKLKESDRLRLDLTALVKVENAVIRNVFNNHCLQKNLKNFLSFMVTVRLANLINLQF